MNPNERLTGESQILTKAANAIIKLDEHGLSRFAFDQLMLLVGMKGKEAIGGQLHLTNYRLVFKAHLVNRVTGKFSIFLPTVQDLRDTSGLIKKTLEVRTHTQTFEFVVWGIPALMAAIQSAKAGLTAEHIATLRQVAVAEYAKCGDGLKVFQELEALNVGLLNGPAVAQIATAAKTPFEASTVLNLGELLADDAS